MPGHEATPDPTMPRPADDTLPAFWRASLADHPQDVMIYKDGVSYTYAEIERRSALMARGLLAKGATKGSRIGLLAGNGPEWVIGWLAINRIGAVAIGLSTFASTAELAYLIPHADISILLTIQRYLRHDYVARLEEAFPALAKADGKQPLALLQAPFLRQVWLAGASDTAWARGSWEHLEAAGAASAVFDYEMLAAAENQVTPADWAVMIYTSGSTAFPKAVVHTHGAMIRKFMFMARRPGIIPYDQHRGDRVIVSAPFFWVGGLLALGGGLLRGTTTLCIDDHSPRSLFELIRDQKATHLGGSEAVMNAVRDAAGDEAHLVDQLRPHNTSQIPFFSRRGTMPTRFANSLGMTETFGPHSGHMNGEPLPEGLDRSVGPLLATMEWKIVDPETGERVPNGVAGELCVRGDWLMDGMYKRERHEVFDKDGYYHTGDECILRDDGYLLYHSRISGMIKTAGANVSPDEVELAIRQLPDVVEVAVFGMPDEKLGEMVTAAVVVSPGSRLDEAAIRGHALSQLSSFKAPKRVLFFDFEDLPRTPSNKVRKPELSEMVRARLADA